MAVLVDLEIAEGDLDLGRITAGDEDIHVFLDRVVPTGSEVMPFFWAEGSDFESFERRVRNEHLVESLVAIERIDDHVLYKVEWDEDVYNFTNVLIESGATILEAQGNNPWLFRLRFADHTGLRDFHNLCRDADIDFRVLNISPQSGPEADSDRFSLTQGQHEAIVTAVEAGYFEVPRKTTLDELATDFDVSPQALSQRIRRAANEILRTVLLSRSAGDLEK